jgi:short-subunit dehydrogenase
VDAALGIVCAAVEELRGLNALVTGAGGGLGGYITRALAAEGVNLALTDLPGAPVDGLAAELRSRGVEVKQAPADLADADERQRLASWAAESVGPLDILVNNAGVEFGGSFLHTTERELETSVVVNLLAVMDLTRIVLPGMLERGRGHVVNMASLAGKASFPYLAAYCATKHGVVGFTHALRGEHGAEPVGFSAICPGLVSRVGMFGRLESQIQAPRLMGTVPPERIGEAVLHAVRKNPAEVIVNKRPVRPLIFLNAMFPRAAMRIIRRKQFMEFGRRAAEVRERL